MRQALSTYIDYIDGVCEQGEQGDATRKRAKAKETTKETKIADAQGYTRLVDEAVERDILFHGHVGPVI